MAGSAVDIGTGGSVTFGTTGFSAQIESVDLSGMAREAIDTSHLGTTAPSSGEMGGRTFIPGDLADPGELSIEGHHDIRQHPPIWAAAETITVTMPMISGDSVAGSISGQGFVTGYDFSVPLEDKMTYSMTVKFSGVLTITDPS